MNPTAPTFPPTSIDYYNYPWHEPDSPTSAVSDNQDKNAICYLTMTNYATPPVPAGIAYSGAFVETGAVLCMNKALFWDSWLLPLLQALNQGTEIVPTTPILEDATSEGWTARAGPNYTFGSNPNHAYSTDSYFGWTPQQGGGSWTWTGESLSSEKTIYVGSYTLKSWETGKSS